MPDGTFGNYDKPLPQPTAESKAAKERELRIGPTLQTAIETYIKDKNIPEEPIGDVSLYDMSAGPSPMHITAGAYRYTTASGEPAVIVKSRHTPKDPGYQTPERSYTKYHALRMDELADLKGEELYLQALSAPVALSVADNGAWTFHAGPSATTSEIINRSRFDSAKGEIFERMKPLEGAFRRTGLDTIITPAALAEAPLPTPPTPAA